MEQTQMKPARRGWNEANVEIKTPAKADRGASKALENKQGVKKEKKGIIPIFFATDNNYLPFLSITLESLWENSSREYDYEMYVLHSGIREDYQEKILRYNEKEGLHISFVDVTERLKPILEHLHMRDYYTATTYFRVFIAGMFPQYDKALYLDCDTVILGDISELYNYDLGNNLLGGAPCEGVNSFDVYKRYVTEVDGLNPDYFFNAGVILMNLKAFREEGFYEQFADLLKKYKFSVIQDEDYLNVICQDRVLRLPRAWNKTPVGPDKLSREELRLVHYIMTWKPWHYDDIPYQEYFWEYAEKTEFYEEIKGLKDAFTVADMEKDKQGEESLKALAQSEINRADGYFKSYGKLFGRV
ncbi:MAG: glycosyltransferase family 8 protein [Clostridia bacterium]|nr:glycosyltransferase family 8 protein [Clostridia bacterium]